MRSASAGSGDDCEVNQPHDDEAHEEGNSDEEDMGDASAPPAGVGTTVPADGAPPSGSSAPAGGLDEGAAAALFGSDYRALGSYMMTLSSRLKGILENIKPKVDPSTRLIALQELSELLSISTEDTLSGYFQIDPFVRELIKIMGGTGNTEDDDGDNGGDDDEHEQDDEAALAAALAMSTGGVMSGDESLEAQMLACRCLANLMEALPGCAHTVVYHGAVPVLCSKLIEIHYIDLAEQTLSVSGSITQLPGTANIGLYRPWKRSRKSTLARSCVKVVSPRCSTTSTSSRRMCSGRPYRPRLTAAGTLQSTTSNRFETCSRSSGTCCRTRTSASWSMRVSASSE